MLWWGWTRGMCFGQWTRAERSRRELILLTTSPSTEQCSQSTMLPFWCSVYSFFSFHFFANCTSYEWWIVLELFIWELNENEINYMFCRFWGRFGILYVPFASITNSGGLNSSSWCNGSDAILRSVAYPDRWILQCHLILETPHTFAVPKSENCTKDVKVPQNLGYTGVFQIFNRFSTNVFDSLVNII